MANPDQIGEADSLAPRFRRSYQACLPCRQRKVKCDLGDVDKPSEPPCARCAREGKECHFSPTRRKRKNSDGTEMVEMDETDAYMVRNARKRSRLNPSNASATSEDGAFARGGSVSSASLATAPLRRPLSKHNSHQSSKQEPNLSSQIENSTSLNGPEDDSEEEEATDAALAVLQTSEVFGGYDALNLLYEATRRSETKITRLNSDQQTPESATATSPLGRHVRRETEPFLLTDSSRAGSGPVSTPSVHESAFIQALQSWTKFRFVRIGWISAREGIDYVQYFYDNMAPLTPLVLPDYRDPATHSHLLNNDPVLAITILTISSRYMDLTGIGSRSRGQAIHTKLWEYLESLIKRLIMGQEHFGGGFWDLHAAGASDVNPTKRKGLRTLSTVLSLMLLTEWHPRTLHFPPDNDDDELMIPDNPSIPFASPGSSRDSVMSAEEGGKRIDSWLEPCWRSDRMCWMLLSVAASLAIEIGVFDETSWQVLARNNPKTPQQDVIDLARSRRQLKDLLHIYVSQTAGRLGLTSILPVSYLDDAFGLHPDQRLLNRLAHLSPNSNILTMSPSNKNTVIQQNPTEMVLHHFLDLAAIMHSANKQAYPNREATWNHILGGAYRDQLAIFQPRVDAWRRDFDACLTVPTAMRLIMEIEYEYTKVYLNSLALYAVVKRCTSREAAHELAGVARDGVSLTTITSEMIAEWIRDDRVYIDQLVNGCRRVLSIVVDHLSPKRLLKFLPVRSYFRIISVTIILIKALVLGAPAPDFTSALSLVERATAALRSNVVDDVHIVNNFCDLSDNLMLRLRRRLTLIKTPGAASSAHRNGYHRARTGSSNGASHAFATATPDTSRQAQFSSTIDASPTQHAAMSSEPMTNNMTHQSTGSTYNASVHLDSSMPPPSMNDYGMSYGDDFPAEWLSLSFDPLAQSQLGANISQTMYGPTVNGHDLMDVLLPEQRIHIDFPDLSHGVASNGALNF